MKHYPYLIIGGGMAGDAAARGIRQVDPDRPIGLIGQELDPPYNRPPLSKGLWRRAPRPMPLSRIWRNTASLGVELHLGRRVVQLDLAQKQAADHLGEIYSFDKLLLATGGDPVRLGPLHERILTYRTLADYQRLRALAEQHQRFAIIGGGFIGSEIAAVLAEAGKEVLMIFPERGIGARMLPEEISQHLTALFREQGVRVLAGQMVSQLVPDENGVGLRTDQGETLPVEYVVTGLGIRPNVSLAEAAGLETGNGILVNEALQTGHPDVFAAGDVANFPSAVFRKRMRVEHEENANITGQLAGLGMAGQPGSYTQIPGVYSTVFDIHYDGVGELDPQMTILYDWQEPFQRGTAYYLEQGRLRGVLLWNMNRGLEMARELIMESREFQPDDLVGKISG